MSKSLENLLSIMFGKSPNGTIFAERERERERERDVVDIFLIYGARFLYWGWLIPDQNIYRAIALFSCNAMAFLHPVSLNPNIHSKT
jgi:hypothetical protein